MNKGISPVVSVVLLIAIAVISAVAVWYWVSPLTGKPPTAGTTQLSVSVTQCTTNATATKLDIRNTGGVMLSSGFDIYYSDNSSKIAGASIDIEPLASGEGGTYTVDGAVLKTATMYFLRASQIPDAPFICT